MPNPWLNVPLTDYEGHMGSAQVHQLGPLADLFEQALAICRPASVAILGIAGGNGLERLDTRRTKRIIGVDINPSYLDTVRWRYAALSGLHLYCLDLAEEGVDAEPVELVHVALVLEHAGTGRCLENALSLVGPGGALSVVLQLPSKIEESVSRTEFSSIQKLRSHFLCVDARGLCDLLHERRFRLIHETRCSLPAGKGFWMGIFRAMR